MEARVGVFTDTYLPTVNGVTYTVKTWREAWQDNGGEMPVVFPKADGYEPDRDEHAVWSLPFPFYDGFRLGLPQLPDALGEVDIVHAHTPFSLGLAALRLVRSSDQPFVASFHTPCGEYTQYISPTDSVANQLSGISQRYERWFLNHAEVVIAPTKSAATYLADEMHIDSDIEVVPNGVDLDRFQPVDAEDFKERHDLPDGPLIGYTGRHGYEKNLHEILEAAAIGPEEWTVVLGGEGPASPDLEARAEKLGVDLVMLGFLEREELTAFYSAIDVFAFPSPVETQGLVALESIACGTPVVGAKARALIETIEPGETGYHYQPGNVKDFASKLEQAFDAHAELEQGCLATRDEISIDVAMDKLEAVYDRILAE